MSEETDESGDIEILRQTVWAMAEDITRMKRVCTQDHPPKMASPTPDWTPGTETRHNDGTRCVLLNDGDWAVLTDQEARPLLGALEDASRDLQDVPEWARPAGLA